MGICRLILQIYIKRGGDQTIIKNLSKWILPIYQKELLNYNYRYIVNYGGAGSGKSVFTAQKLIIKSLQHKRRVLIIRDVGATLKNSVWDLMFDLLSKMPQVIKSVNKTDMVIKLINGSQFLFKGLDDP